MLACMGRFLIALVIVVAFVAGAFIAFRRSKPPRLPQDLIERVNTREKQIEAKERAEGDD